MSDIVFAIPVLDQLPSRDLRRLFDIADFADELTQCLTQLVSDRWQQADQRISEIQLELVPLLLEHRRCYPSRDGRTQAPAPRRDPFDADARTIARAIDDDASWPIIAFL